MCREIVSLESLLLLELEYQDFMMDEHEFMNRYWGTGAGNVEEKIKLQLFL